MEELIIVMCDTTESDDNDKKDSCNKLLGKSQDLVRNRRALSHSCVIQIWKRNSVEDGNRVISDPDLDSKEIMKSITELQW